MRDRGRDMYTRWGLRLYSVNIVRVVASGGRKRGDGADHVLGSWEILPVPTVADLQTLTQIVSASQIREQGTVIVSGISGAYTEDTLMGRGGDGNPIPAGEAVYYELVFNAPRGGGSNQRRRLTPSSAPSYDAVKAEWSIVLQVSYGGRDRAGIPRDGAT